MSFCNTWPSVNSVIESIAADSNSWFIWYTHPAPETLPLPISHKEEETLVKDSMTTADDDQENKQQSKGDQGISTGSDHSDSEGSNQPSIDMTKLLAIKCLRPDRFHNTMATLCASDFNKFHSQMDYNFDDLMSCTGDPKPVLILLPSSKDETHGIDERRTFAASYGADILAQIARVKKFSAFPTIFILKGKSYPKQYSLYQVLSKLNKQN